MDVLTHTLSGLAAGTAVSSFTVKERAILRSLPVMLAGMLGGFMPDLDAMSLWSRFDKLFASWHGLNATGKEIYFGRYTLSHHGAMHSMFAGIAWSVLFLALAWGIRYLFMKENNTAQAISPYVPAAVALFAGYCMHLLGDLPTPGYVWGGIRLWWPASSTSGGLDLIWWWNNYDIFIVVLCAVTANLALCAAAGFSKRRFIKFMPAAVLVLMIATSGFMVYCRQYKYNYTSFRKQFADMESKSIEEQRRILGDRLFGIMAAIDRRLPFNF